jgi:hypothetical protein
MRSSSVGLKKHWQNASVRGVGDAAEAIGDLVETVTGLRDPGRLGDLAVEIAGRLSAPLGERAYPNRIEVV